MKYCMPLVLLILLVSCNLFMYNGRNVPPQQIPALTHIYTKTIPQELRIISYDNIVLSGTPESTEVLIYGYIGSSDQKKFLRISGNFVEPLLNNTATPSLLMRFNGNGFGIYRGTSNDYFFSTIIMTNQDLSYGTGFQFSNNNTSLVGIPDFRRQPIFDFQNQRLVILGTDEINIGTSSTNDFGTTFTPPRSSPNLANMLKNAFIQLTNANYPDTSFWNTQTYTTKQIETLYDEGIFLFSLSKSGGLRTYYERYLMLYDSNTGTLSGPRRVFLEIPAVLFKDTNGTIWILQPVYKDTYSLTFQLLDKNLAIRKKLVVYGDMVHPLGVQIIGGVPGLVFLTYVSMWNIPNQYISLFFLPFSKLEQL